MGESTRQAASPDSQRALLTSPEAPQITRRSYREILFSRIFPCEISSKFVAPPFGTANSGFRGVAERFFQPRPGLRVLLRPALMSHMSSVSLKQARRRGLSWMCAAPVLRVRACRSAARVTVSGPGASSPQPKAKLRRSRLTCFPRES